MSYILSEINYRRAIEIEEKKLLIENIKEEQLRIIKILNEVDSEIKEETIYSKETKERLNFLKDLLIDTLNAKGCWINYALEKCLKRELPSKIKIVCLRTKDSIKENQIKISNYEIKLSEQISESEKRRKGSELLSELYNQEDFKDIKEMFDFRQWECLIDLIETGCVTRKELPEYGINLEE